MFKKVTVAVFATALAGMAHAGDLSAPKIEPRVVVDDAAGSSGNGNGLAITLMLLAAIAIVADGSSGPLPSDARLKTDIHPVGHAANGLPLYEFRYIGDKTLWRGVMAQDVLAHTPEAVVTMDNGFYAVDYQMLGLTMQRVD